MTLNRTTLAFLAALLCSTAASADTFNLSVTIDGSQEVPPTGVSGTGTAVITFDDVTNLLSWNISWSGLTGPAVAMHFHNAPAGSNGPVVINTGAISGLTSPSIGSTVISAANATELLAERLYINIHTGAHPAGEIRGQVVTLGAIPTVGEWGLIVLALLMLTAGTIIIRRETAVQAAA